MAADINDELSTTTTNASTSYVPTSLSVKALEQQASIEIKRSLSSTSLADPSTQRALLPSPIFDTSHERTAIEAGLESDDEEQIEEFDVSNNPGYGQGADSALSKSSGRILTYGVDNDEEEYELIEEEDIKHDEEFILVSLIEYILRRSLFGRLLTQNTRANSTSTKK